MSISKELSDILNASDYNVVNFEASVVCDAQPEKKSGPSLSQSRESANWLIEHGFNVFSLANNHIMDYGIEGFAVTQRAFSQQHILGAGTWEEAYRPLILNDGNVKVALFAMTELQFGILHDKWEQKHKTGCAWINHPDVDELIKKTKQQVDYVIMIAHAGLENEDIPLPEWRDRYRRLIDCGCDAVVAGHTHTAQGYEIYKNKPIFYSLGNFYFPSKKQNNRKWKRSLVVSLVLEKSQGITFDVKGLLAEDNSVNVIPSKEWNSELQELQNLLDESCYMSNIRKMVLNKMSMYNNLFNMAGYIHPDKYIVKSIARKILGRCNALHLLNNLQCETHRWCLCRALELNKS